MQFQACDARKSGVYLDVNEHFEGEHICWEKVLDTTLDKFRGDGLYFDVLPIAKIICQRQQMMPYINKERQNRLFIKPLITPKGYM